MKKLIITTALALAVVSMNAAPLTWKLLDANQDGSANMEEWLAAQKVANPKAKPDAHAKWFKNWDKDKNGKISKKEFDARKAWQKKQNAAKNKGQQGNAQGKKKGKKS
ncbi:MAG: EF-hand domain-containing protein [Puniceicoccaceae bacterium]